MNKALKPLLVTLLALTASPILAGGGTTCGGIENSAITASTPTADFTDNGNGTVTHNKTGLMWKRCSQGQSWNGTDCSIGSATGFTWSNALAQAQAENSAPMPAGGHTDWRLPNVKELESIVEERCFSPAINVDIFPNTPPTSFYWSSSPYASGASFAWFVRFSDGFVSAFGKGNVNPVRLVRAGQ